MQGKYGELYPQTVEGKIIVIVIITCGGELFGTYAENMAASFIKPEEQEDIRRDKEIMVEVQALRKEIEKLRDRRND